MNVDDACLLTVLLTLFVQIYLADLSEGNRKLARMTNGSESATRDFATVSCREKMLMEIAKGIGQPVN